MNDLLFPLEIVSTPRPFGGSDSGNATRNETVK